MLSVASILSNTIYVFPPEFTHGFNGVRVARYFVFSVEYLSFLFWQFQCLSFVTLRLLITPLWYLQTLLSYIQSCLAH